MTLFWDFWNKFGIHNHYGGHHDNSSNDYGSGTLLSYQYGGAVVGRGDVHYGDEDALTQGLDGNFQFMRSGFQKLYGDSDHDIFVVDADSSQYTINAHHSSVSVIGNCTWDTLVGFEYVKFSDGLFNLTTGEMESVQPVNEAPEFTNITSGDWISVDENQTYVGDIDAYDANGDELTYSIVGGADADRFEIDSMTGELSFNSAPDFEAQDSAIGNDAIYDVDVKVSDNNGGESVANLYIDVKDVDEVVEPPLQNIVDIAAGSSDFEILVKALGAANLVDAVRDANGVTVFAPTDAAFGLLVQDLGFDGDPTDKDAVFGFIAANVPSSLLVDILTYHVATDEDSGIISTLNGETITQSGDTLIDMEDDLTDPMTVGSPIEAANGYIQVIDRVLLPTDVVDPQAPVNTDPEANNDVVDAVLANDEEVSGPLDFLTGNDYDADGDALTVVSVVSAQGASVNLIDADGDGVVDTVSYDPSASAALSALAAGETATDIVTYEITDGNGGFDTAEVTLTIAGSESENGGYEGVTAYDEVGVEEELQGTDLEDSFIISGSIADYTGGVVSTDEGGTKATVTNTVTGETDILFDFEVVKFDDAIVYVEDYLSA